VFGNFGAGSPYPNRLAYSESVNLFCRKTAFVVEIPEESFGQLKTHDFFSPASGAVAVLDSWN
jgi:hypothetical protein